MNLFIIAIITVIFILVITILCMSAQEDPGTDAADQLFRSKEEPELMDPNLWIKTITVYKKLSTHEYVEITEFIDRKSLYRCIEPQSGTHIRAESRYVVVSKISQDICTYEEKKLLTMEEVYENYQWFFEIAREMFY